MDKKYLIVPAILAGIGVVAAGSLGLVNLVTAPVIKANESKVEVTSEMKAMYPNGTFSVFEGVSQETIKGAAGYEVLVHSAFKVVDGGNEAYVFDVRGKTDKGTVKIYVSFDSKDANNVKPVKVVLYEHSDAGYKGKAQTYVDGIVSGSVSADDLNGTKTGATLSCKCVFDEINAAKKLYVEKVLGGSVVDKDFELDFAKEMYPNASVKKTENFETIHFDNPVTAKGSTTYNKVDITNLFVAEEAGKTYSIYETDAGRTGASGERITLFISFTGDVPAEQSATYAADKISIYANTQSYANDDDIKAIINTMTADGFDWSKAPGSGQYTASTGASIRQSAAVVYYSIKNARETYVASHTVA